MDEERSTQLCHPGLPCDCGLVTHSSPVNDHGMLHRFKET